MKPWQLSGSTVGCVIGLPAFADAPVWSRKRSRWSTPPSHCLPPTTLMEQRQNSPCHCLLNTLLQDARMDIVHITYQPTADQISSSDAEFSRRSIAARRDAGYRDLKQALREAPWFTHDKPEALCALVHKVKDGEVKTLSATQPTTSGATMKR